MRNLVVADGNGPECECLLEQLLGDQVRIVVAE